MSVGAGRGSTVTVVTAATAKPGGDAVAAVTAVTAPTVAPVPPRVRDESSPSHGDRGSHGCPCPVVGPCPPSERHAVAGSRRDTAVTAVTA
jgi:hypothetical protein